MTDSTPFPDRVAPPIPGSDPPLSAVEAALALGITEDGVLIRQRRGELPTRPSVADLDADIALPEPTPAAGTVVSLR